MQIVEPDPSKYIKEHDKILRRCLAEREHEWQSLQGIRRLLKRIEIEIWAWRKTSRELRGDPRNLYLRKRLIPTQ